MLLFQTISLHHFLKGGVVALQWSVELAINRSQVRAGHYGVKTLGKFLTPMCLCHQAL